MSILRCPVVLLSQVAAITLALSAPLHAAQFPILDLPLQAAQVSKPLTMLTLGRDHTLFYEAYNDASDIDGDGTLDIRFKPTITYYGLFDSYLCYSHSGGANNSDVFTPVAQTTTLGKCANSSHWSGNWLNYATTSRIDALRKVFYGGYREVDSSTETILRRTYIPQDAHSWAKEYTSEAVDGYKISDYTGLSQPNANRRHFFGNLTDTRSTNCSTLDSCSDRPPLLRVITNADNRRVWQWASTERPVLHETDNHNGTRTDYTVRVKVCTSTYNSGCKRYPNGNWKPTGLLHDYGENNSMLFGLLTGSYNKSMSGGVLRKVVSSFTDEVNSNTGVFTSNNTIVKTMNALRIRDYNNNRTDQAYAGGWVTTRPMNEGEFPDWGNPIAEIMYETLRYFAGKSAATTAFATSGGVDGHIGLPVATWDDPYSALSSAKAPWCARPNMLVVSGVNPSFDSDQLPGSAFDSFSGDLSGLNVQTEANTITAGEPSIPGMRFIGQVGSNYDGAPTAKSVSSIGNIRGLAPEEPTKRGSYYSASVARFGKINDLRSDLTGRQSVDSFVVALSSPLPKIEVPVGGRKVTLVPFAKSVGGSGISNAKGDFQPTNQIVDFYVDTIVNSSNLDSNPAINGGRYFARFRINFEDVEQGADHDMDAIVVYEVAVESNGSVRVKLTPEYQAGGIYHSMGYIISGTTKDGVYLVVRDESAAPSYYLNVPDGRDPGYCDASPMPASCGTLPYTANPVQSSERFFSAGNTSASLLKDPLWYAAKWGGFTDRNGNNTPDLPLEWDGDGDGVPDTYFLVQNPLKLKEALKKSFDSIVERSASAGNITSNGQEIRGGDRVFQSSFNSATWDGELVAKSSSSIDQILWRASEKVPTPANRKIYTWKTGTPAGSEFQWTSIGTTLQGQLGSLDVLNYIRGDQSKEIRNGGTFRNRNKLLGDIIHSSPYYVKDSNTVFVGANDGMLHAFNAETGAETFAYIPGLVFNKLSELTAASYGHKFYVDGDVAVSTKTQTSGKNLLIGSPGRGAKGLFGLDVTQPTSFNTGSRADILWELSPDSDLGFVLGRPQIGVANNNTAVAVVGNGYNSTNESAVLYVINLQTGAVIRKIDTGATGSNGLATPTLVDVNGDTKFDYVYAGDHQGNVWKFDLRSATPADWALTSATPLFVAKDDADKRQPITAKILVASNSLKDDVNIGKTFLLFGTGSYYFQTDPGDQSVQSWYGVIDDGTVISGRAALKARTINLVGTVSGKSVRTFSSSAPNDMAGKKGWYIDLKDPNPRGERIVTQSQLIFASQPALLVSSIIPTTSDPCMPEGKGFINAVNAFTGAALTDYFFDISGDGNFNTSDLISGQHIGSFDPGVGMPGEGVIVGDEIIVGGSSGGGLGKTKVNIGPKKTGRISWREIRLK